MPQEQIQRRFVELRFDGEKTVSGTLVRYGDVAKLPWGLERFEPGAFGDLSQKDVALNVMHERGRIVARTNPQRGQAKLELIDSPEKLDLRATLADTTDGRDALQMVKDDLLRGFSVEFIEQETRSEAVNGEPMDVQVRADLRGAGMVDRPAYGQSVINPRWTPGTEEAMGEKEIRELIERMQKDGKVDAGELARPVSAELQKSVRAEIDTALKQRDEERTKKEQAEKDAADSKASIEEAAEQRAELLTMVAPLLPKDFDRAGKTTKDILVAAAGDEVQDAANRSEDYLRAKIETIIERRKPDGEGALQHRADDASATGDPMGVYAIYKLREAS